MTGRARVSGSIIKPWHSCLGIGDVDLLQGTRNPGMIVWGSGMLFPETIQKKTEPRRRNREAETRRTPRFSTEGKDKP